MTGIKSDDCSIWDCGQPSQRRRAHRWAFARLDDYLLPRNVHAVTARNNGCVQLVDDEGYVATLDVDESDRPTVAWYGRVMPERLADVRRGDLDAAWFAFPPERRTAPTPVDVEDLADSAGRPVDWRFYERRADRNAADRDADGLVSVYSGVIELLANPKRPAVMDDDGWCDDPDPQELLQTIRAHGTFPESYETEWLGA